MDIAEHIKIKHTTEEENGVMFDAFFPNFIWAVRDFTLELKIDGKDVTSNEYLERALQFKTGIRHLN